MSWKMWMRDYFSFTRKERVGLICLIALILFIVTLPHLRQTANGSRYPLSDTTWITALQKLEIRQDQSKEAKFSSPEKKYTEHFDKVNETASATLFNFDPNLISDDEWKKLGLSDKTIHTIKNYLSKGGHFKQAEDLQKVYGLKTRDYERLLPYIKINNELTEKKSNGFIENKKEPKGKTLTPIDINLADTSAFIALPGIGSKLAARIINFRERLGGFYSIDQLGEVYGLSDSTFQEIKPYLNLADACVKQINVNKATLAELKAHPYLKFDIAKAIVTYRNEHGPFLKLEDIKKIMLVTEEVFRKVSPYLSL